MAASTWHMLQVKLQVRVHVKEQVKVHVKVQEQLSSWSILLEGCFSTISLRYTKKFKSLGNCCLPFPTKAASMGLFSLVSSLVSVGGEYILLPSLINNGQADEK